MRKSVLFLFFFVGLFLYSLIVSPVSKAADACPKDVTCTFNGKECESLNKNECGTFACGAVNPDTLIGLCTESATNPNAPLTTPNLKTAGSDNKSIKLQWNRVIGAKTYEVRDSNGSLVKRVEASTTSVVNTSVETTTTNSQYKFTVRACRDGTCGEASNEVAETTSGTTGKKNLGQICSTNITTGAESECSVGTCVGVGMGVCARLGDGNSEVPLKGFVPSLKVASKTGNSVTFNVENPTSGSVKLADVDKYVVFYRKEGETLYQTQTVQTANFTISGLSNKSSYTFHLFAMNKSGPSENSNNVTETTSETEEKVATSCSNWDCNGKWCSRLNVTSGGPYCNITSQKGEPLSCSCGEPPPPPSPPCKPSDMDENGICKKLWTSLGIQLDTTPAGLAKTLFGIVLSISGGLAVILLMTSGYQIMTSAGDPEKIQGAKDTITSTIIGLVFIIFSLVILQIIGVDVLRIPGLNK